MKAVMLKILSAGVLFVAAASVMAQGKLTATIVGSGSPVFNDERASASVLIDNGVTKILLDMGNGTQANLAKLKINDKTLDALMFTHHHLDHNEEFLPIFIHSLLGKQSFAIYGPPNTEDMSHAFITLFKQDIEYRLSKSKRRLSDREDRFVVTDLQGGESFKVGDIKVTTLKVPHTIHSLAYRFDYLGESIVVTGDLTYSDKVAAFAKEVDYLIIDSGGMQMSHTNKRKGKKANNAQASQRVRKAGKTNRNGRVIAHLNLAESSLIASDAGVKNLVYTHFSKGIVDEEASLDIIRDSYQGKVTFAEDLIRLK